MTHRKYHFLTIFLLLIFLGQTTAAAAMVCKMDFQSASPKMSMDHANMNHSMSIEENSSLDSSLELGDSSMQMNQGCCKSNANCSMSGCIALAVPIKVEITKPRFFSETSESIEVQTANQYPLSLFRPPISA